MHLKCIPHKQLLLFKPVSAFQYDFKITNLFFGNVLFAINPMQCIFIQTL